MIQDLVEIIVDVQRIEYDVAMAMLYASSVYDKISDIRCRTFRSQTAATQYTHICGNRA